MEHKVYVGRTHNCVGEGMRLVYKKNKDGSVRKGSKPKVEKIEGHARWASPRTKKHKEWKAAKEEQAAARAAEAERARRRARTAQTRAQRASASAAQVAAPRTSRRRSTAA